MRQVEGPISPGEWVEYRRGLGTALAQVKAVAFNNSTPARYWYDVSPSGRDDYIDWTTVPDSGIVGVVEPCEGDPVEWLLAQI